MENTFIKSGEQPRYFRFGSNNYATGSANSDAIYKESPYSAFQAIVTGTGSVAATVAIQVSNEEATGQGTNSNWITIATISLSGTTTATNTGYGTALFVSPGNAVTFSRQFESAPTVQVGLQQGVGSGVSAYPGSVSATGFTVYGVTHTTAIAVTYNYVATGILRSY